MKRFFLASICLLIISTSAFAADMQSAADLYYANQYQRAIDEYEAIYKSGQESADLYYNLGNSYLKLYMDSASYPLLAQAILNYERALRMDPVNEDIKFNLEFAKAQNPDNIEVPEVSVVERWWNSFGDLTTPQNWSIISIVLFVLTLSLLLCYIFVKVKWVRVAGFSLGIVMLLLSVVSFVISRQQEWEYTDRSYGIVKVANMYVVDSPEKVKESSGTILHGGTKVKMLEHVGSALEIETESGGRGWVDADAVDPI